MDNTKLHFLENIPCVIKDSSKNVSQDVVKKNSETSTKILYKPIFFKVHDINNITLYQNITQNVGINLTDYMTKVQTFVMLINNVKVNEYARNGQYVLFTLTTNEISDEVGGGEYHILTQDYEYITSGKYTIS